MADENSGQGEVDLGPIAFLDRSDVTGTGREDLWRQSLLDISQMAVDAVGEWIPMGPSGITTGPADTNFYGAGPISGILTAVAIDPTSPAATPHIYAGTGEGGLWFSGDGGTTWSELTEELPFRSVGALAISPTADPTKPVLFLGTGNTSNSAQPRGFTGGGGLYRSFDGGRTWAALGGGAQATVFAGVAINSILLLADRILVATSSNLYMSKDNGLTFSIALGGNVTAAYRDTDTAGSPNVVYACVSGAGVRVSTDSGDHWNVNLFDNMPAALKPTPFSNVAFAQGDGAANRNHMYVSVQYNPPVGDPGYKGLFYSNNGGTAWQPRADAARVCNNIPDGGAKQTNYDFTLGVDPLDPSRVYIGFQQLWLSTNFGLNFGGPIPAGGSISDTAVTHNKVHYDHHTIVFSPPAHRGAAAPTRVYVGTDGGLALSSDGGLNWSNPNSGLHSNLVYGLGIGRGGGNGFTYIGMQDDGTAVNPAPGAASPQSWAANVNSDGGNTAVDPDNPQIAYGFTGGNLVQTTDAGATWPSVGSLTNTTYITMRCIALGPVTAGGNPKSNRVLYVSFEKQLFRSQASGSDLRDGLVSAGGSQIASFAVPISAVAITSLDTKRIWLGLFDGSVLLSLDGVNFQKVLTGNGNPVNAIAIDEADVTTLPRVAVCVGNFSTVSPNNRTQHVYLTTNNGGKWDDVSGTDGGDRTTNLPDAAAYDVVFDPSTHTAATPSRLICALDGGIVHSLDDGKTWKRLGVGLPVIACTGLAIDSSAGPPTPPVLRASTWGRSCYEFHISSASLGAPASILRVSTDNLGFGAVAVNCSSVLFVDIYNIGNQPLIINSFVLSSGSNTFTIAASGSPPGPVPPGGKTNYSVTFTPTAAGNVDGILLINTNDPDPANSPWTIAVTGTGVALHGGPPYLAILPNHLGFGTVNGSASADLKVTLLNTGYDDLNITGIVPSGASDFSLTPAPVFNPIHPCQSMDVIVRFAPSDEGKREATFQVNSNDPNVAKTFTVSGVGANVGSAWAAVGWAILGVVLAAGIGLTALAVYDAAEHKSFGSL